MKNKNLWLSLIIAFGIIFLITWVVPSTSYDSDGTLALGSINPTGIWDIFYYLSMIPSWFGQNAIFLAFLAIFYGVIGKTGALRVLVDRIALKFKKREKIFLLISSSFFILLSGLTGIYFPLLVFVPLAVGVILTLGFNKITALMATIVPILVGFMGSLYSQLLYANISNYVEAGIAYGWFKFALIIITLITVGLYLYLTAKIGKSKEKEEINEEMLFLEKKDGKKPKIWPIVTVFILIFVLYVLGLTPWSSMLKFNGFIDFHNAMMDVKLGSFAIFKSIFGVSASAFGTWSVMDAAALLGLFTIVLGFVYKVKVEEFFKNAVSGLAKFLPMIVLVLVVNFVFVVASQAGVINTIIKAIAGLSKGINVFTYSLLSLIGSAIVNENYITGYVTGVLNTLLGESANLPLLVFIQQVMYGIAMLIAPTSVLLLVGLSYLEVGYTKWIKNIWKLLLILMVIGLAVLFVATAL